MSPDEAQRLRSLLQCLRAHGVPNRLAIPLLMRLRGECYSAAAFIQWQGISRQYLTLLLSDARAPSQAMRSALALYLGVDPFAPVVPAKVDCAGDCR